MTTAIEPAAPPRAQAQAIKDLLRSQPALADGGDLLIAYARDWARQASWICAYARAAGLTVRLAALLDRAASFTQRLRSESAACAGLTIIVLTSVELELPGGCLQLAGLPEASPLHLWQPQDAIAATAKSRAQVTAGALALRTGQGSRLSVEVSDAGWQPDLGLRAGGSSRVSPAGAIRAEVTSASGTFVADGAIALNRPVTWDARLSTRPVTISVTDRVVTDVGCDDDTVAHFLRRALFVHRAATVASIAIGTRDDLGEFSPQQGPVNSCQGVAVRLVVPGEGAYSPASADLQLDLVARRQW